MNKVTVTVGIPAYNEEGNIKKLIEAILAQKGDFELQSIIVASDGSTDQTNNIINSFSDPKITLLSDDQRLGQAARQNEILKNFDSEILILLNADVLPVDQNMIHNLISPFKNNPALGLVGGRTIPLKAKSFFERIINFSVSIKEDMARQIKNANNIYFCNGRIRAFSKTFVKDFKFGKAVSEDAYSYLECKAKGLDFLYQPKAAVYYKSPENLRDHLRQSIRFIQGQTNLSKFFPDELIKKEHHISFKILLTTCLKYLIKQPVLFAGYIVVFFWSLIKSKKSIQARLVWETAESSKILK
jgi:cellulose synthase/poly-beta-1,6-N-acetylglucosamine synthase-like glycosyltransferase